MSNLKDLYISQSYFGIINLEDSTQNLASQSGDIQLQDGSGDNIGLTINAQTQEFTVVNNFRVDGNADFNGNVDISGSYTHTGSLDILGDITASGNIRATIGNFDTINTRILHVTEESASVIFSSGSNILGDEITDTQVLSGSVFIPNVEYLAGNPVDTDTRINNLNDSSASQQQSIDSLNSYTQSNDIYNSNFSASVSGGQHIQDQRLDSLESFTSSQETINGFYNQFTSSLNSYTQSTDIRLDNIEAFTSSLVADFVTDTEYSSSIAVVTGSLIEQIDTKLDSGSFNSWTSSVYLVDSASFDDRIDQLELDTGSQDQRIDSLEAFTSSQETINSGYNSFTSSYYTDSASFDNRIDELVLETGSYATTGSNTFIGDQVFSGSVQGDVHAITIASNTASIDCSQGNFFTLEQSSAVDTHLVATNITGGRTITLRINKTNSGATVSYNTGSIKFPSGFGYSITDGVNKQDVITFVTFDTSAVYAVNAKNFV